MMKSNNVSKTRMLLKEKAVCGWPLLGRESRRRKSSDSSTVALCLFPPRVGGGDSRWSGVSFAAVLGGERQRDTETEMGEIFLQFEGKSPFGSLFS